MRKFAMFDVFIDRTKFTEIQQCLNNLSFPFESFLRITYIFFTLNPIDTKILIDPYFSSFGRVVTD